MPDRAGVRLVAFGAALVAVLVGGFAVGRVAGPTRTPPPAGADMAMGTEGDGHTHSQAGTVAAGADVGGLAVAAGGYALVPRSTSFVAGATAPFEFQVAGADRRPVTTFAVAHDRPLHLVVVRRDLSGYQHLHPMMAPDGTWRVDLRLPDPGVWRAFADFTAVGAGGAQAQLTLGVDLSVAGAYRPVALPAPTRQSTVDGMAVRYQGTPSVGSAQPLLFTVAAPLERYLAAYGHLVVLREGDLGYVHVHPEDQLSNGAVKFWLAAPSPGRYRMFFDFQVAGTVHTAAFTVEVP